MLDRFEPASSTRDHHQQLNVIAWNVGQTLYVLTVLVSICSLSLYCDVISVCGAHDLYSPTGTRIPWLAMRYNTFWHMH